MSKLYDPATGREIEVELNTLISGVNNPLIVDGSITTAKISSSQINANISLNAQAMAHHMIMTPKGPYTLDELLKKAEEYEKWKEIKGVLEAHQIIEEWPDGDIVIRIKRKKVERAQATGQKLEAYDYRVDFGVEEDDEEAE